jgi:hypothetical protein
MKRAGVEPILVEPCETLAQPPDRLGRGREGTRRRPTLRAGRARCGGERCHRGKEMASVHHPFYTPPRPQAKPGKIRGLAPRAQVMT